MGNTATTTLVVKKFFHPKSNQEKLVHQSLGFSDASKQKTTRPTVAAPHTKPRFYSYVPLDDSVFLIRTTKKQQKKKFLFSVLFILKKREKNLKEKKILANYCISLDDYYFF